MHAVAAPGSLRLRVEGMDCASCVAKIETALRRVDGVGVVRVNLGAGTVAVTPGAVIPSELAVTDAIRRLGFRVAEPGPAEEVRSSSADASLPWWRTGKGMLVLASGGLLGLAMLVDHLAPSAGSWPFMVASLVALIPVARRAIAAARSGSIFTIEMLMTIAAVGALVIDAAAEAAVVVFLFAVGELLEGVAAARARRSITALSELTPKTARLVEGDVVREVAADTVVPGEVVLVRPGDRIPCDGRIIDGTSGIDEAPVTGESLPRHKALGDEVFAGTVNLDAALRVEATRGAANNTIARVVRLVEEAQEAKAPIERFIDRFARVYMPLVVAGAVLVAVVLPLALGGDWSTWTYRALALLLIACPCALVISTPAAVASGLAVGARRGLLIKGGGVLEALAGIRTVALDKTGTLTRGRPEVTDVIGLAEDDREVLRLVAALELGSSHPIARAVIERAEAMGLQLPAARGIQAVPGLGLVGRIGDRTLAIVSPHSLSAETLTPTMAETIERLEAEGKTIAVLTSGLTALGLLAVRDEPREDARDGLAALRRLDVTAIMLTGDNRRAAAAVATGLDVEMRAELLPEDKARIVRELQAQGRGPIAKVGDGINDAPALAVAEVGIAMGGGTDVALETADAALLSDRVAGVAEMIALARATLANIRQNVAIALGLKAVFLVTTVLGMTGMWIAILADTGATVLVTVNALRLLQLSPAQRGLTP